MYTIFVSLAVGTLVGALIKLSGTIHSTAGAILPAILVTLAAGILIFRRVSTRITPIVEEAQQHMQGQRVDMALQSLRNGLRWTKWHPLLEPQLRTQIGILLYLRGRYDEALPELRRGTKQQWESRAYLACLYFKRKDEAPMVKAFEDAVKPGEKEEFFWSLYAYCLNAQGKKDDAQAVLRRGLEKLPANARLQELIDDVKTGSKFPMAQKFRDRWAMFQLEKGAVPTGGQDIPKFARGRASRPGFREKPQRKR